jgi:hypothetical protein
MADYTDTILLNCSRKSGVEARSGNNSQTAIWTNQLGQAIRLDVGDKVEMESVFINNVGSANAQTIEFSGKQKSGLNAINNIPKYTVTQKLESFDFQSVTYDARYRLGKYRKLSTTEVTDESIPIQDNIAPLIYGYYITSNEYPLYISQPRNYAFPYIRDQIPDNDTRRALFRGLDDDTRGESRFPLNLNMYVFDDYHDVYKTRLRIDNSRFTLFVKDNVYYDYTLQDSETQFPTKSHNGIFSEATYYRVRDRLDINVNRGFNTPSSVAEQITNQLTETQPAESFEIIESGLGTEKHKRVLTQIVTSNTYKSIECVNYYQFNSSNYTAYINSTLPIGGQGGTANNQDLTDYIGSFAYVGIKRPEIFETGREMAKLVPNCPAILKSDGNTLTPLLNDPDDGFQIVTDISYGADPTIRKGAYINTNIPYTRENLQKIKTFLDTQALYPELWDSIRNTVDYSMATQLNYTTSPETLDPRYTPTADKSRFFHINQYSIDPTIIGQQIFNDGFGCDNYKPQKDDLNNPKNTCSTVVFFEYQDDNKDLYLEPSKYSGAETRLSYGFARAFNIQQHTEDPASPGTYIASDYYTIQLNTSTLGIPSSAATDFIYEGIDLYDGIAATRRIGFDFHANAYSTCIISPYCGRASVDIGTTTKDAQNVTYNCPETHTRLATLDPFDTQGNTYVDIAPYYTQVYVGANNPELRYNNETNRFELVRLHTANNVGNTAFAGNPAENINNTTDTTNLSLKPPSISADSGDTVYKLNPRPSQLGFSPIFKPYRNKAQQIYRNTAYPTDPHDNGANTANLQYIQAQNVNIKPFSVFDAHGGIYIESFGYEENQWEDNLWDILGFRHDAVQAAPSSANVITKRVTNDNKTSLYRPTTNAEVVSTDSKAFFTNRFGATMYYTAPPYPYNMFQAVQAGTTHKSFNPTFPYFSYIPEVTIKTESITITATDLQKSVLKPYYAIRSSILEGFTAIGGDPTGAQLPLISVVDKYSAQGDFFFGKGQIQFTITKPTIISDVTTAITDPDGELSNCDESSAIVYKITKLKRTPENILQMIFKEAEKSKK